MAKTRTMAKTDPGSPPVLSPPPTNKRTGKKKALRVPLRVHPLDWTSPLQPRVLTPPPPRCEPRKKMMQRLPSSLPPLDRTHRRLRLFPLQFQIRRLLPRLLIRPPPRSALMKKMTQRLPLFVHPPDRMHRRLPLFPLQFKKGLTGGPVPRTNALFAALLISRVSVFGAASRKSIRWPLTSLTDMVTNTITSTINPYLRRLSTR